jgi:hypothetical protein
MAFNSPMESFLNPPKLGHSVRIALGFPGSHVDLKEGGENPPALAAVAVPPRETARDRRQWPECFF